MLADIQRQRQDLHAARGPQFLGRGFGVRQLARRDHQVGAAVGQRVGHVIAQGARAAGDERDFARQ